MVFIVLQGLVEVGRTRYSIRLDLLTEKLIQARDSPGLLNFSIVVRWVRFSVRLGSGYW